MKKIILILISFSTLFSNLFGQVKVSDLGALSIGTLNNPVTGARLQVVGGYSLFTERAKNIFSAPMIRGANQFTTPYRPDFTWWKDEQTGIFHPEKNEIGFSSNGLERMRIRSTNYTLNVFGAIYASGGIWTPSDQHLKTDIEPVQNALKTINQLNGYTYKYINPETKEDPNQYNEGKNYGFLAQELAAVLPELTKQDEEGKYAVNYEMLIPILVEAIKEQNLKIAELEKEMNQLKAKSNSNLQVKSNR